MDRRRTNIRILRETMQILEKGSYEKNGKKVILQLSRNEMEKAVVFLPENLPDPAAAPAGCTSKTVFECLNDDSFSAGIRLLSEGEDQKVLVLNFANAFNPGGGVRHGASAQEESLCRCSSLLLSLESDIACLYYAYNEEHAGNMGSDAMILNPYVEVIRDKNCELLEQTKVLSVLTCAAPNLMFGLEGLTEDQYKEVFYGRIRKIVETAAALGYRKLVLGAFGCGAFLNDPELTAGFFDRAFREFKAGEKRADDCFEKVVFAVLDHSENLENFRSFSRFFG